MSNPSMDLPPEPPSAPTITFSLRPIGLVHAESRKRSRSPRYIIPRGRATLELFQPFLPGLQGLYGGLEIWVLTYHTPPDQGPDGNRPPGVFATTALERPNPIGFQRARVVEFQPELGLLHVEGLDVANGTPLLDIRPAAPQPRLTPRIPDKEHP